MEFYLRNAGPNLAIFDLIDLKTVTIIKLKKNNNRCNRSS